MIVNSVSVNQPQPSPQKRKLGDYEQMDSAESNFYFEPKKRHIQTFSNASSCLYSIENSSEISFNLNNNAFINDLFSYDEISMPSLIQSAPTAVHTESTGSAGSLEANWQSADLLELGNTYNSSEFEQAEVSNASESPKRAADTAETDLEDKNLSWLFNFKLEELPHLSPEVNRSNSSYSAGKGGHNNQGSPTSSRSGGKVHSKTLRKFEELVMEVTSADVDAVDGGGSDGCVVLENCSALKMPKKPPFTYTELIEYALEDKGELTVSGIYQWISDRFPFYKSNDDRWKNSVRHNLSINPHFRKGAKAPQGAGHLWTISSGDSEENVLAWEHKKQRLELFFKMESIQREKHQSLEREEKEKEYDEAAAAAAIISQEMSSANNDRLPAIGAELPFNDLVDEDDLRRSAGEILNGIRRDVEVQAINSIISTYHDAMMDSEHYLNPINKDVVVTESGLRNDTSYYVTDIDPISLGINMNNVEEEVLFSDEFNLNYFGISSSSDIVASI